MTNLQNARRRLAVLSRLLTDLEVRAARDRARGYVTEETCRRKEIEALRWATGIAGRLVDRAAGAAADVAAVEAEENSGQGVIDYYARKLGW